GALGGVVVLQPPVELAEDVLGIAAGRPDEEDPVEAVLVGRVALLQALSGVALLGVDAGLLLLRLRPAALADPRLARQRLLKLPVGELAGRAVGLGEECLPVGVGLPGQDVVRPARDREAGEQHLAGGLDPHQQNPGTASHASPAGGASSLITWTSISP